MNIFNKLWLGQATLDDQEEACKNPRLAYYFASRVSGADIEKCQEAACKDPHMAFRFFLEIKEADIEKCQEAACKDPYWAYCFAKYISRADIEKCIEACKGTDFEDMLNEYLIEKALQ